MRQFSEKRLPYDENALLIESPIVGLYVQSALDGFRNIGIYDFDPKLSKKPVPITSLSELEMNGSNLAIVLNNVMRTKEDRRIFLNLLQDLLPFIQRYRCGKGSGQIHILQAT